MDESLYTCFASAERSLQSEILRQYKVIADNEELVIFLNSAGSMICVLNMNRQIVFVNEMALDVLNTIPSNINDPIDIYHVLGERVGEAFGCQYAFSVNGCGTSQYCRTCGAVRSMLTCVNQRTAIEECSVTNSIARVTFDLRVHSTYTKVYGEDFIICSLFDISNEKRRGVMEHIFFHDIMNTVQGISGITNELDNISDNERPIYNSYLTLLVNSLTEQISSYRVLTMAEKNEYQPSKHELSSLDFLSEEVEKYQQQAAVEAKEIYIANDSENHPFISDKILLSRVLSNMIKNALEAEPSGAVIEVGVRKGNDGYLYFWVHNDYVMSEKDKLQVFHRSFSTKGENRGLGTYSMKLLTEKYLKGQTYFESEQNKGTVFTVRIPFSIEF